MIGGPSWRVDITRQAERDLKRLPEREHARLRAAIDVLAARPLEQEIRKLHGTEDEWRLRVGAWRVRFTFVQAERTIQVLRVLPRARAYRD